MFFKSNASIFIYSADKSKTSASQKYSIENCLKLFGNEICTETETLDSKRTNLLDHHRCLRTHSVVLIT